MKFSKKDIRLKLREGIMVKKKNLFLKEDSNTTANINPTNPNGGMANLATDLADAKKDLSTAKTYEVDSNDYDQNKENNPIVVDITGATTADQAKAMQDVMKSPMGKAANQANGIKFQVKNESRKIEQRLQKLRENSVGFTKQEIINLLKR